MPHFAVVTNCTNKKRFAPEPRQMARTMARSDISGLSQEWSSRRMGANTVAARDLYSGRSFKIAEKAARHCDAELFAVSAGYGLVSADDQIPAYSVTVSGDSEDNVLAMAGGAKSSSWWKALPPLRSTIADLSKADLVMMALPAEYLFMIEDELELLKRSMRGTLLIFACPGAARRLRPSLAENVMPYDNALEGSDSPIRGTGTDAAQRRLLHFVTHVATSIAGDISLDAAKGAVSAFTRSCAASRRRLGRPAEDKEILDLIRKAKATGLSSWTASLRYLRTIEGLACSQSRFQTLFQSLQ